MEFISGSAVRIEAEVEPVTGTGVSIATIKDSLGNLVASNISMTFSVDEPEIAIGFWPSSETNLEGRYTYLIKAMNGQKASYAEGHFFLKGRT